jgi:DNA-binding CsgD family transcriptional regulator
MLTHISESKIYYGLDLPESNLEIYENEYSSDKSAQNSLKKMGFVGEEAIKQFITCRFGGNDKQSDIINNKTTPDYYNCGKRGVCKHEFIVCRPVFSSTGEKLSRCEIAVIKLIAEDLTDECIADKLCVSVNTIKSHRATITQKLNVKTKNGIVRFAVENNILK